MSIDPRTAAKNRQYVKEVLENYLYRNVNEKFNKRLYDIIVNNTVNSRHPHYSFTYKGQFYSIEQSVPRIKNQRLLPEYHTQMDEWLADKKELDYNEAPYISNIFTKIVTASDSPIDYRRLLPERMHPALDSLVYAEVPPSTLTDAQVEAFKQKHEKLLLMIRKRMVIDFLT